MASIQKQYQARMAALTPAQRVARSMAMLKWSRDVMARQILKDDPDCPRDQLKWKVALRMYGSDPHMRLMIERILNRVSD